MIKNVKGEDKDYSENGKALFIKEFKDMKKEFETLILSQEKPCKQTLLRHDWIFTYPPVFYFKPLK